MLGAIIGDLAASTYQTDKNTFFSHLVGEHVPLTECGYTALCTADILYKDLFIGYEDFQKSLKSKFRILNDEAIQMMDNPSYWDETNLSSKIRKYIPLLLMGSVVCAWFGETYEDSLEIPHLYFGHGIDKEEWYARSFLIQMIYLLRNGATKDETYKKLGDVFGGCRHKWPWKTEEGGALSYLLRAWDAFYSAFDFGSAIHNAVKMVGNTHLNCALTGAIAEAMYGCDCYIKKEKYCENYNIRVFISIPKAIKERFKPQFEVIRKQHRWMSVFFKKNEAATNVELHYFKPVENQFANKVISRELRRRIFKAYQPDWEARFGVYLDNGWLYLYRSLCLIGRFKLRPTGNDNYCISDLQQSDEGHNVNIALKSFLDVVTSKFGYVAYSDWHFKYFSPFSNEVECPFKYKGSVNEKFWDGEMMFYSDIIDDHIRWIESAKETLRSRKNSKLYTNAKELGPENFGIAYYIETLYSKWCPYDNLDWVLEY
jgi:hypothetical protein